MQFDVKKFQCVRSDFKLTFKNTGKLPKIAMGHNLVILKKEYLQLSSDKKSCAWKCNKRITSKCNGHVLVATKLSVQEKVKCLTSKCHWKKDHISMYARFPHFAMMRGVMEVE